MFNVKQLFDEIAIFFVTISNLIESLQLYKADNTQTEGLLTFNIKP